MGRTKKYKRQKTYVQDQQHSTVRAAAKKREEKVIKKNCFNVFAQDWATGWKRV